MGEPLAADEKSAPHVIMFPAPVQGHLAPYTELAWKLCALGINITYVNIEHNISRLKAAEGDTFGIEGGKIQLVALPNGEGYTPHDSPLLLMNTLEERTSKHFEKWLQSMMEGSPTGTQESRDWATPCCGIVDSFNGWALKMIDRFDIPGYIYWTTTATALASLMHAPLLHAQGIIPIHFSLRNDFKPLDVPCIPPLHPLDIIGGLQRGDHVAHQVTLRSGKYPLESSGILVNSIYELEAEVFDALRKYYHVGFKESKLRRIIPIGPSVPASVFSNEDSNGNLPTGVTMERDPILHWLDKQPPSCVLYISFGSIATLSVAQVEELALGLERSQQRFIWVLKPPSSPGVAPTVDAHKYLPPGFEDRTKERGLIVTGWAPQICILQHPATGGFLTHCGWNSILESIGAGIPMITWPIQAEQMMNSRWLVETAQAAIKVHKSANNFVQKDEVERAVRVLMCDEKGRIAKCKILEMKALVHKSITDDTSGKNLREFANDLYHWNDRTIISTRPN